MPTIGRLALGLALAVALLGPGTANAQNLFFPLTPCRLVDTRLPAGPSGGPALAPNTTRSFPVQGQCGVPIGAKAAALTITVAAPTGPGNLRLFPSGSAVPLVSNINFSGNDAEIANGGIVPLSTNANDLSVFTVLLGGTGTVHLILDVNGYFAPPVPPGP